MNGLSGIFFTVDISNQHLTTRMHGVLLSVCIKHFAVGVDNRLSLCYTHKSEN
jgi:hypothetical protein